MRARPEHQSYPVDQPGATASLARQDSSHSVLVTRGQLCNLHVLRSRGAPSNGAGNALQHMTAEGEGRSFVEEFGVMFLVSSVFGVHVIRRIGHGSYCLSVPRVCVGLVIICLMTGCLVLPLVALYHIEASYDLRILLLSLFLSGITSSFIFAVWLLDSPKMMVFFAEVDGHTAAVRRPKWLWLVMAAVCLLSLLYTVAFLFITPLPDGLIHANTMKLIFLTPVFLSSVVPCLMDIYVMLCVHVVVVQLRGLQGRVQDATAWTPHFTNDIANHWLRISKLLEALNEAFSFVLHLRMLLFLVETISLLYSLVSLRWHGRCLFYFMVMAQRDLAVVCHFLAVCVSGERLLTAQEAVAGAVREVHAKSKPAQLEGSGSNKPKEGLETAAPFSHCEEDADKAPESRLARLCVHNLLCRMEARPLSVHIWGDSSLSGRTYVTCMGLVATYLVVLLQLRLPSGGGGGEDVQCFQVMK